MNTLYINLYLRIDAEQVEGDVVEVVGGSEAMS